MKELSVKPSAVAQRLWRAKNTDKVLGYKKKYSSTHKEQIIESSKRYSRENHDEICRRARAYRIKNLEAVRKREKNRIVRNPESYLLYSSRRRAKEHNIDFNLELSDIIIPDYCPVLGIKLERGDRTFWHNSPSLDRIDNTKGYVKGNIMVISFRANNLKSDATPKELRLLADFYYKLYHITEQEQWNAREATGTNETSV